MIPQILRMALFLLFAQNTHAMPIDLQSKKFLEEYGYISAFGSGKCSQMDGRSFAIKKFQHMANIPQTGVIDSATKEAMKKPRCGNRDYDNKNGRFGYATQRPIWTKNVLTYRITQYTNDLTKAQVDETIRSAFKIWESATNLKFTEKSSGDIDIEIKFVERYLGGAFDGPGKVLAHGYFPINGGDVHFDDGEQWTINTASGINLLALAVHEFGHSLGLAHTDIKDAIMYPYYRGYTPTLSLHADDIDGIQSLYPTSVNFCDSSMDAALVAAGKTYFFKGHFYVLLDGSKLASGYPRKISDDWPGLPGNLDAAVTMSKTGHTYFFKGDSYYEYNGKVKVSGPNKIASKFSDVPSNLDAVLEWTNKRVYLFKGDQYYRLNTALNGIGSSYPSKIRPTAWPGVPSDLDGALRWTNGRSYFFKGSGYYRYNDDKDKVDDGYPLDIGIEWFGCAERK